MKKMIETFKQMRTSMWKEKSTSQKEQLLQEIVGFYANKFSLECPKVWFADFGQDNAVARFFPEANVIEIRRDVAIDGVVKTNNNNGTQDKSAMAVFYYLMHEIEHAKQRVESEYPEHSKRVILLRNNKQDPDLNINTYFSKESKRNPGMRHFAYLIYSLQPTERFAWEFAEREYVGFVKLMHRLFPDDLDYINANPPLNYQDIWNEAKMMLRSNDPEKDIDNILLTMNGQFVEEPLNEFICTIIKETQHESMYQRIKAQQEINQRIVEEKLKEASVEEIEIDEDWFVERK